MKQPLKFFIGVALLLGSTSKLFSQWTLLETGWETNCPVAVSESVLATGDEVYIFLTNTDHQVYYNNFVLLNNTLVGVNSWRQVTFPGVVPRDWFDSPVTFTKLNGELYVFGRIREFGNPAFNKDLPANSIFWAHTTDGQNHWTDWTPLPGGGTTAEPMQALTCNGGIFLFGIGVNDRKIYQNVFTNNEWRGWVPVGDATFAKGISATIAANRLYLFGISNDYTLIKNSAAIRPDNTTDWSTWEPVSETGEKFYSTVTATNYADKEIHLFGIKYNNVQHGVGIVENINTLPPTNRRSTLGLAKANWTGWHSLEENDDSFYYHAPSVSSDMRLNERKIIFAISHRKLYYRFL